MTHLLVVVVVGVDVIVVLLVSHVLLIAQLTVETGVPFLLHRGRKRDGSKEEKGKGKEKRVSIGNLTYCIESFCGDLENHCTINEMHGS